MGRSAGAIFRSSRKVRPIDDVEYSAFVDMSGSSDDVALGIAHWDAWMYSPGHPVNVTDKVVRNARAAVQ